MEGGVFVRVFFLGIVTGRSCWFVWVGAKVSTVLLVLREHGNAVRLG